MCMGFFSSHSSKKTSERVFVVHVGSGTVAGAFVSIDEGLTTILSTDVANIAIVPDLASADFELEMQKALAAMLVKVQKKSLGKPDRIIVYLGSPWYASQVRVARMSRPTAFVASSALLGDMVTRELKAFETEELAASHRNGEPLAPIESKILEVKLNGYPNVAPVGLSARELELSILLSVTPERTRAGIHAIIERHYATRVSYATFLAASFVVTRNFFPHEENYLLVDIGGEITDVAVVRDSVLVRSVSFPHGRNFILRKLSHGLKRSIHESVAITSLYCENKVEDSIRDACTGILKDVRDEWLGAFQKALFAQGSDLSIPETIFLTVPSDVAPWFADTIRREEFHRHTLTSKDLKMVVLEAQVFHESLGFATGVERNPFIMIEALASAR
jgi:hypothetical protein